MTGCVKRWHRFGKDRLYVTAEDGTNLGYRDLLTGENHVADPARSAEFFAEIAEWALGNRQGPPDKAPAGTATRAAVATDPALDSAAGQPTPPVLEPTAEGARAMQSASALLERHADGSDWEDLALRRAGANAREQAIALRRAAPVRTLVARALGVKNDERAWRIGADGEEKVAGQLAKLARKDQRWHYINAIPVGENGADIDHLVIGPPGVFSLNAKHHPGSSVWVGGNTMMINGERHPYIYNARHEAQRAARLLSTACGFPVTVTGMVVPVDAEKITIKSPPDDVHVVNRMRLVPWFRELSPALSDDHITAIFDAARRSTTWRLAG